MVEEVVIEDGMEDGDDELELDYSYDEDEDDGVEDLQLDLAPWSLRMFTYLSV